MRPGEKEMPDRKRTLWDLFKLTERGHLKSTFFLYSFALGFLDLAICFFSYFLLLEPLDSLLAGAPLWLVNMVEGAVPAGVATLFCLAPGLFARDRRLGPAGFLWMLFYLGVMVAAVLAILDGPDRSAFLELCGMYLWAPVVLGGVGSVLVWQWRKKREQ